MKSILHFAFAIILLLPEMGFGQTIESSIINGTWQGILIQQEGNKTKNFAYWMDITLSGDSVFGTVRTEVAKTTYFALIRLKGKIKFNKIQFEQDKILKNITRPESFWCLIKGELTYNASDNSLSGQWNSAMQNCKSGSLLLYKSPKKINTGDNINNVYSNFEEIETKLKNKETLNGIKIILSKIMFASNSHLIEGDAKSETDKIIKLLTTYKVMKINIQGHTDDTGPDELNMKLSYLRAKEIYNLLLSQGMDISQITYEGYGKSRPLETNDTEEGKMKNRRVEIEITVNFAEK